MTEEKVRSIFEQFSHNPESFSDVKAIDGFEVRVTKSGLEIELTSKRVFLEVTSILIFI